MTCPICKKDTDPKYRPFCSRRCADVDLGRWLTESYAIPAPEGEEDTPPELDDEDRLPRQ
ncbi:MAG: DNA gyrase inhibitor YacG [Pseudotabrizicola sp.]|uniref:DNA gyrase inhibitor YacG n=1 Tax=Pseudotabrizicola sp. TaxID=2939647 RepID=UPI00272761F7|nr:DNA gyrase inhibitor YacG [Pseudotabrizicola sp.]MDO8882076.1 DNA gyrase inhibitor YacG [Pseudotabrizicola sp.]MDP2080527.1 DNA gyrase inhibitor YacG [Pseudotabrizicola sp.]MDZ7573255.1 DNA gyrase inhibitor YacG [Pseudotabrizicola sp.]